MNEPTTRFVARPPHAARHDHQWYCDALAAEIPRVAQALAATAPATAVVTCPGWTTADLAAHIGTVHRWAAATVRQHARERVRVRDLDLAKPDDPAALPEWVAAGATPVVCTFRDADPDEPVWVWGADPHVRFWPRRMLHESVVHRVDATLTAGEPPEVDPEIAMDGIEELLDNLASAVSFAPQVIELRGAGETLHLHATDADGEWTITLVPDGYEWARAHSKATVALRGPAAELLLVLYRRGSPESGNITSFGEKAVLDRWLAHSAL